MLYAHKVILDRNDLTLEILDSAHNVSRIISILTCHSQTINSIGATRLAPFLQATQSSGSFHISFKLSPVHSFAFSNIKCKMCYVTSFYSSREVYQKSNCTHVNILLIFTVGFTEHFAQFHCLPQNTTISSV